MRAAQVTLIAAGIASLCAARPAIAGVHFKEVPIESTSTVKCGHDVMPPDKITMSKAKDVTLWDVGYRPSAGLTQPCHVILCSYLKHPDGKYHLDPNVFESCLIASNSTGTASYGLNKAFSMSATETAWFMCRANTIGTAVMFIDSGVTASECEEILPDYPPAGRHGKKPKKTEEPRTHIIDIDIVN